MPSADRVRRQRRLVARELARHALDNSELARRATGLHEEAALQEQQRVRLHGLLRGRRERDRQMTGKRIGLAALLAAAAVGAVVYSARSTAGGTAGPAALERARVAGDTLPASTAAVLRKVGERPE